MFGFPLTGAAMPPNRSILLRYEFNLVSCLSSPWAITVTQSRWIATLIPVMTSERRQVMTMVRTRNDQEATITPSDAPSEDNWPTLERCEKNTGVRWLSQLLT
jgi:hypothetical protein